MILVQLLDTIISDKIKVIPDLYHHYLSTYHVYKSTLFSPWGSHILVTMVTICSNKLFLSFTNPPNNLVKEDFDYI